MTTDTISQLRQRMIEDMNARKLCAGTQRGHILSCKQFAAFLKRSPDTTTLEDVRRFQLHLIESGVSICNRNRIVTGVKFLLKVALRRHDLAAEIYHLREPLKLPLILSPEEAKRLLAMAGNLKVQAMLTLGYGCGLRAGEMSGSKPGTSTAPRTSSASCNPKAAKTGMSCCQRKCWPCCGNGGRRGQRDPMPEYRRWSAGCSLGEGRANR